MITLSMFKYLLLIIDALIFEPDMCVNYYINVGTTKYNLLRKFK